jgi:hypothetical protein
MAQIGLLKFTREILGFKRYEVTGTGAAAGLWLPAELTGKP